MSYSFKSCNIEDVVDLLDISRKPTQKAADSFDVCCPFCGKKSKYKMNVNTVKNVFHCFSCGRSGGVLDLYGQYRFGESYDSREVYQALSKELKGFTGESSCVNQQKADKYEEILPASDDVLDETYSALLSLPILALSDEDKKALLKRGLAEEEIGRIGFASIPESFSDPEMEDLYTLLGAGKLKDETSALRYVKKTDLLLGLRIAKELLGMGKTLDHVPGFFKLCDTWCFKVAGNGTLIPARNMKHQVVGLQIRLKNKTKSGLRYMTVSSKGLDEGVSTAIARTHFSFGENNGFTENTKVFLTEGPLKAEVISHFLKEKGWTNYCIIAMPGVSSNKELPSIAKVLKEHGITTIHDMFDMDKCVNPSVMKALFSAKEILSKEGLSFQMHFWDKEYASMKADLLRKLCEENYISPEKTGNVYRDIALMSSVLSDLSIPYDIAMKDGEIINERWRDTTKGYDDYAKSLNHTCRK